MEHTGLTAISPIDGRYQNKTNPLKLIFSEYGLFRFRVQVEIEWLKALANHHDLPELPPFSADSLSLLNNIKNTFSIEDAKKVKEIEKTSNHDVKAIEYFIRDKLGATLSTANPFIHFACTSEDINNLSHALMLKEAHEDILLPRLKTLIANLQELTDHFATIPMLSRTHGQIASPTTLGKEIGVYVHRLLRQATKLDSILFMGKMNGAVGNFNAHLLTYPDIDWMTLSKTFVEGLGLHWNPHTTQIESHDYMAEYFAVLSHINTILIDFNRDIWGYISLDYFKLKLNKSEIGSSTMPHKINPIDFENAEGNLGLANALFYHLVQKLPISRWQRDLTDSTTIRNMGVGIAHILISFDSISKGLAKLDINQTRINQDLEQAWEVLAEPIQMVMRRYGIDNAYEQLKELTRGQRINQETLHCFIKKLAIPDVAKMALTKLTPQNYLGNAVMQAKHIAKQ